MRELLYLKDDQIKEFIEKLFISYRESFADAKKTLNKYSIYECGFDPYDDARQKFDVRFYIIAILFLIFDLEVLFLIPWCVSLSFLTETAFWGLFDFIIEIVVVVYFI